MEYYKFLFFFFFFSSRRRHTRCSRDWSSDVCSSDLDDGKRIGIKRRSVDDRTIIDRRGIGRDEERCSGRSEEHTSELQSRLHLVCRLLLEKKKNESQTPLCSDSRLCSGQTDYV